MILNEKPPKIIIIKKIYESFSKKKRMQKFKKLDENYANRKKLTIKDIKNKKN